LGAIVEKPPAVIPLILVVEFLFNCGIERIVSRQVSWLFPWMGEENSLPASGWLRSVGADLIAGTVGGMAQAVVGLFPFLGGG